MTPQMRHAQRLERMRGHTNERHDEDDCDITSVEGSEEAESQITPST